MRERQAHRILQISAKECPPALRVVKEGISLHLAGFSSAVLSPPFGNQSEQETWNGIEIFRPGILAPTGRPLDNLLLHGAFFSFAWYKAIKSAIAEYRPTALHIHDIWLGRTTLAASSGQKVVMDLHENMAGAVVEYAKSFDGYRKWIFTSLRSRSRTLRYEGAMLRASDRILTVVEEARLRVLEDHPSLNPKRVVRVENLESRRFLCDAGASQANFGKDHFSVLYIGGFGAHRGLETLIRSMARIKEWGLNLRIHLIGARPGYFLDQLKALVGNLGVEQQTNILQWVPQANVLANILQADVCCVPHNSNPHTDKTIPHKLYQYMIAKKPVLVSTSTPIARVVRQAKSGLIFEAGNAEDCAVKLRELYLNRTQLDTYGQNGYRYVIDDGHNWEDEAAPALVAMYDELLGCGATGS